jgi:hypothetical protein
VRGPVAPARNGQVAGRLAARLLHGSLRRRSDVDDSMRARPVTRVCLSVWVGDINGADGWGKGVRRNRKVRGAGERGRVPLRSLVT